LNLKKAVETDNKFVFQTYRRTPILITKGKGVYVYDDSGRKYLDFLGGIAVNALGHCNARVNSSVKAQLAKLSHVSNLYYSEPMLNLAVRLTKVAGMSKIFYCNSGAEANEAAIKLVRRFHSEIKKDGRFEIICFRNSFHGRTLGSLSATGQDVYKKGFAPLMPGFKFADFNDIASVKKLITGKTAAIMLEPIQGEAGVYPATREFMAGLDALRKKHGLELIFDEVQCGLGRTGRWFAYQSYNVKPDVVTMAKSIGAGLPLGAMMARGAVTAGFEPGSHASTFGAGPVACTAALAFMDEVEKKDLLANVKRKGDYIVSQLKSLRAKYPEIVEVRGKGLMIGVEVDADARKAAAFFLENGMIVNAIRQNIIRILPPYIIDEKHAGRFVSLLKAFFDKAREEAK